jgi:hypothetical protein
MSPRPAALISSLFTQVPTARIKNLDPGVVMGAIIVNGMLTVCSGIASTTLWFNNYDCRCRILHSPGPIWGYSSGAEHLRSERQRPAKPMVGAKLLR